MPNIPLCQLKSIIDPRKVNPNTYDIVTVNNCFNIAHQFGFEIFENRLNIWGIRVPKGDNFNDIFLYFWKKDNQWSFIKTWGTTEPAPGYLNTLIGKGNKNPNGIFVLSSNRQWKACWEMGYHKGQYLALKQRPGYIFLGLRKKKDQPFNYYLGDIYDDVQGLNMHSTKKGLINDFIGGFSEGCQAIKDYNLFEDSIMPIVVRFNQKDYDYTIVDELFFKQLYN